MPRSIRGAMLLELTGCGALSRGADSGASRRLGIRAKELFSSTEQNVFRHQADVLIRVLAACVSRPCAAIGNGSHEFGRWVD